MRSEADRARIARHRPQSGMATPRFSGPASFMRLPVIDPSEAPGRIEIGLIGIPFDGATTNRPGARLGPRGVREANQFSWAPMQEVAKLTAGSNGALDEADYQRTVDTLLAGGSDPVISKAPEGAWSHAITDKALQ